MWRIDASGFLKENIFPSFHENKVYDLVGVNTLRMGLKFRNSPAPNATCTVLKGGTDIPDGRMINPNKAIFDIDQPDAYNIDFWCGNRSAIVNGVCNARWFVQITIEPEFMNDPPMHSLVNELYRKLGLRLNDPRNTFLWEGYECPGELL